MKKLLICNCCGDEARSPVSMYLLKEKPREVKDGVAKLAEREEAEILYFLPEGSRVEELSDAKVKYGKESLVTCNPFAILEELKGNMPRPLIRDGIVPEYEGKQVILTTPEEAYRISAGKDTKFIYFIRKGKTQVIQADCQAPMEGLFDVSSAKALLLGGLRGKFILPERLCDFKVGTDALYDSVTVYEDTDCMVDAAVRLMEEAWKASCGKCVLCREGTLQFYTILSEIVQGKAKQKDTGLLKEAGEIIKEGAYCAFGKNMPGPMLSALELFVGEFEEHIKKKSCRAAVCFQEEKGYVILPKNCSGCGDCMDECEEDAIIGKKGFIHMIDEDMCESCGKCVSACEEGAIIKVSGAKPRLPKKLTKVGKF